MKNWLPYGILHTGGKDTGRYKFAYKIAIKYREGKIDYNTTLYLQEGNSNGVYLREGKNE